MAKCCGRKAGETDEALAEDFYVPVEFVTAIVSWELFGDDSASARAPHEPPATNGVDLDVVRRAYDWELAIDGEIHGLTAGDQGFEPTGIKVPLEHLRNSLEAILEAQASRPAPQPLTVAVDCDHIFNIVAWFRHEDVGRHCSKCGCFMPNTRPAPPLDWQPIETAPKDGRYLLLVETMEPSSSDLHINPDAKSVTRVTVGRWASPGWDRYGVGSIAEHRLSLWAPFPDPPAAVPQAAPTE